jgi:hypothetical protein
MLQTLIYMILVSTLGTEITNILVCQVICVSFTSEVLRGEKKVESIRLLAAPRSIVPMPGNPVSALEQSRPEPHIIYTSILPTTTSAPRKPAPAPKMKHTNRKYS